MNGLRTSAIASHLDKDKNVIRYHFGGLDGLKNAYLTQAELRPPLFQPVDRIAEIPHEKMPELTSDLLEKTFDFFMDNPERQQTVHLDDK